MHIVVASQLVMGTICIRFLYFVLSGLLLLLVSLFLLFISILYYFYLIGGGGIGGWREFWAKATAIVIEVSISLASILLISQQVYLMDKPICIFDTS